MSCGAEVSSIMFIITQVTVYNMHRLTTSKSFDNIDTYLVSNIKISIQEANILNDIIEIHDEATSTICCSQVSPSQSKSVQVSPSQSSI